jgi:tetratricopeptide (TPR) repeat protein
VETYGLRKGKNMKLLKDVNSADSALTLRNAIWAFPYLAVMGLIWGYLAGGSSGAVVGLVVAFLVSATIGSAASTITGRLGEGAGNTLFGLGRRTIGIRERMAGDLNVVRYHKLCNQFEDALLKIDAVLAKDPDFPEALFLKAQILWEGFEDRQAAKACLLKIIKVEPNKETVFRRWALNLYRELSDRVQTEK